VERGFPSKWHTTQSLFCPTLEGQCLIARNESCAPPDLPLSFPVTGARLVGAYHSTGHCSTCVRRRSVSFHAFRYHCINSRNGMHSIPACNCNTVLIRILKNNRHNETLDCASLSTFRRFQQSHCAKHASLVINTSTMRFRSASPIS
jgi:hypothetical protein